MQRDKKYVLKIYFVFYCVDVLKKVFRNSHSWKNVRKTSIMSFSRKQLNTPCWGFFWSSPPGFLFKFTLTPWNFPFFLHFPTPGNPLFPLIFGVPTWNLEFQQLLLYPMEFSINILNWGESTIVFWKSPMYQRRQKDFWKDFL